MKKATFYKFAITGGDYRIKSAEDTIQECMAAISRMKQLDIKMFGHPDEYHIFKMNPFTGVIYYDKEVIT